MKRSTALATLAAGAAAIGLSLASPAAADNSGSNCQTVGSSTFCAQGGDVRGGGGQSASPPAPAVGPQTGGCTNAYGAYQNCRVGGG